MFSRTVSFTVRAALALLLFAFPAFCSAQQFEQHDKYFVRKGYSYTLGKKFVDTITSIDPMTGDEVCSQRATTALPLTMNGHKVYESRDVTTPAQAPSPIAMTLDLHLLTRLKEPLRTCYFSDPKMQLTVMVHIRNVIVDEKGQVVFFELNEVRAIDPNGRNRVLNTEKLTPLLNKTMSDLPPLIPATLNGENVIAYTVIDLKQYDITQKGRDISYTIHKQKNSN